MYKIKENNKNKLVAVGKYGEEIIHVIHCGETITEIKQDFAKPFIIAEECTNSARLHLVTDFSEDEALQQVDEYLREKEEVTETHLIGVFKVDLT